jgi:two-component system NtrC family sensor kinase
MIKVRHIYFLMIVFISNQLCSQIIYCNENENLNITNQIYYFEDNSNSLKINQVINNSHFTLVNRPIPNFGITASSIWLKISIQNNSNINNLLLQINQPIIDEVEFYNLDTINNTFNIVKTGEEIPFGLRKYLTPEYLFDLSIAKYQTKTYYLKFKCKENMQIPLVIGSPLSMFNNSILSNVASGVYMGIMLVMILYNLFIYRIFRDKSYVLYSLYIIFTMLTQTSLQGYPFQILWPNYPSLAIYSPFLFPSLVSVFGLEFFKHFLRLKERFVLAYKISFIFILPYSISVILSFLGIYGVSFMLMELTSSIVSIFMLVVAYKVYRKGFSEARFFLLGWSIFLIGVCIYVLKDFEILPYNTFTRYTMHFGSAAEVILLSFALADRINILKKEKEESQAAALNALQQNDKLITEQNVILESKVKARTLELRNTLENLKDTQAQLVNAEKMASLGQLTAGIAHEINNPINFVSANVKPLKMDIEDVLALVKKYEGLSPDKITTNDFEEIEKFRNEIDIEYLKKEMESLLLGIEDGAKRTAEIVSGLRNFSRLDESDVKEVNINDGIGSTLILLKSAVPPNTKIITHLSEIPLIECLPGKLNQVFMNLFSNALYAIKQKNSEDENSLTVSTYISGENVIVEIKDTGIGMTPEVKAKIFDPFFTTKDVGEGTGLGMSIVFKIIESHGAKIVVESEYGVGTKILLILNKKINFTPAI